MSENEFAARTREHQGVPVIDLKGEINGFAETKLNSAFAEAGRSNPARLLLNFRDVSYINSTGIALIVGLLAQARKSRIELMVAGLSEHYRHIFSITRLADFMSIHDDEASAIAQLSAPLAETQGGSAHA